MSPSDSRLRAVPAHDLISPLFTTASNVLAFAFIVAIGTNCANYYSQETPILGITVLAGLGWFGLREVLLKRHSEALAVMLSAYAMAWIALIFAPIALMLASDKVFERSDWTSQSFSFLVLLVGFLMASDQRHRSAVANGALATAIVCSGLNLYELLVENNLWSTAPGRSAGWHINPNISSSSICIYGIIYFWLRDGGFRKVQDTILLIILFCGILSTFSRAGFVQLLSLPVAALASTTGRDTTRRLPKIAAMAAVVAWVAWLALGMIAPTLSLEQDANQRLASLYGAGEKDASILEREAAVEHYWSVFLDSPLTGAGVRTSGAGVSADAPGGPHNMYIALAADLGILALLAYIALQLRWLQDGVALMRIGVPRALDLLLSLFWLVSLSFTSHDILNSPNDLLALSIAISVTSRMRAVRWLRAGQG